MTTQVGGRSFELHSLLGVGSFGSVKPSMLRNFQPLKKNVGTRGFPSWVLLEFRGTFSTFFWDGDGTHLNMNEKVQRFLSQGVTQKVRIFDHGSIAGLARQLQWFWENSCPSRRRTFCFHFKKVELNDEKLWRCWNNGETIFLLDANIDLDVKFRFTIVSPFHHWFTSGCFFQEVFFSSYWWISVEVHQEILTFSKESMEVESPKKFQLNHGRVREFIFRVMARNGLFLTILI